MKELPSDIDPVEFFAFFADYNDYPTNGYRLAEAAKQRGCSDNLVAFFGGMPGTFEAEGDILTLAEDFNKPPWGTALEGTAEKASPETEELTLNDITKGAPKRPRSLDK
jgi:hypothetical protein